MNVLEAKTNHEKNFSNQVIQQTMQFVRNKLEGESTGHDWWHIHRVYELSLYIAEQENGVDMLVVALGALLHDIADYKFYDGDETIGPRVAGEWLASCGLDTDIIIHVQDIIKTISFKGAGVTTSMRTLEGKIVQDADRLDALGAVGIARCFAYGGSKGRMIYNPDENPVLHTSFETYKKSAGNSLNHFHEKLLLLKNLMNTEKGKEIAQMRHNQMEKFVKDFMDQWHGQDYRL